MKRLFVMAAVVFALSACNSDGARGEGGSVDDGIAPVDRDGALRSDTGIQYTPETDTAKGEDRVDVQPRK
ncbi:hypothetical protein V9K67_25240 [Paraflavisolibacter sp. H34]|uniref:hypothetical protein n=1 Tax=Huijunlia imazamoxiresistens TaxID=3127457 RepID=UPI0030160530